MGRAPGYLRQVGVSGPSALPQADAGDFGAGVGAAIERAGDQLHASEVRAYQIQRRFDADQQHADFAKRFAQARLDLGAARIAARTNAGPGAAGHEKAMEAQFDATMKGLVDGISEDSVRRDAEQQLQGYRSSFLEGEVAFELGKRAAKVATDVVETGKLFEADTRTGGDYADNVRQWNRTIDGLQGVDAETRETIRRNGQAGLALAIIGRGLDDNPKVTRALIASGAYNDVLDGDQLDRALAQADAAARIRDAEERALAQQVKQEQKEALATRRAELDTGAGKPSDWGDLAAGYEAIGDTSNAVTARAKGVEMQASLAYRGSTVPQMDTRIAALTAKQHGKGLSTAEASELKGLQSLRSETATRLSQPGGALQQQQYATGKPIAPLDLDNPASFRARASISKAAAANYGRATIEPLLPEEMRPLQDLMGGSAGQKQQALEMIANFGDPDVIRGAARQIAGDDRGFRIAATFINEAAGRALARDILNGPDALKANAGIWREQDARAVFSAYQGPLLGMGPEYAADTFEAAKAIYASQMKATGASAWNAEAYRRAVEASMGGVRSGAAYKGGTATSNGARVMIPSGWTGDGVFRRIARMTGEDLHNAAVRGRGYQADGSPLYTGQLRQMVPVYLGGTNYGFRWPQSNRLLLAESGGPFVLDVAKVPWR